MPSLPHTAAWDRVWSLRLSQGSCLFSGCPYPYAETVTRNGRKYRVCPLHAERLRG